MEEYLFKLLRESLILNLYSFLLGMNDKTKGTHTICMLGVLKKIKDQWKNNIDNNRLNCSSHFCFWFQKQYIWLAKDEFYLGVGRLARSLDIYFVFTLCILRLCIWILLKKKQWGWLINPHQIQKYKWHSKVIQRWWLYFRVEIKVLKNLIYISLSCIWWKIANLF